MGSRTRVYLILTSMALLALGIDRFYLGVTMPLSTQAGEPADSDDSGDLNAESGTARNRQPVAGATPLGVPQLHFPRNLPVYDPTSDLRDIFARSKSPDEVRLEAATGASTSGVAPEAIGRENFSSRHQIAAVMIQDRLKIAVIDGRWMRVGENLEGCELTRIEGDFAVFQCHDGEVVLSPNRSRKHLSD